MARALALLVCLAASVAAESRGSRHTCTPQACVPGIVDAAHVGARIARPEIHLYPGTYASASSPQLAALLPHGEFVTPGSAANTTSANADDKEHRIPFGNSYIRPFPGSSVTVSSSRGGEYAAGDWSIVVEPESQVQLFVETGYQTLLDSLVVDQLPLVQGNVSSGTHSHFNTTVASTNTSASTSRTTTKTKWKSLLLPPETYIRFSPLPPRTRSSLTRTSSSPNGGLLIRGSVRDRQALSRDVLDGEWGMDLLPVIATGGEGGEWVLGSDACSPSCSPIGGTCLPSPPSNTSTTFDDATNLFTCRCSKGFTGPSCSVCSEGYYGPSCIACPAQCFFGSSPLAMTTTGQKEAGRCDDGLAGSGGCLGVVGDSKASCNCAHGTCTSSTTCSCSAGWTTPVNTSPATTTRPELCSVCGDGWFMDGLTGDCLACPLGAIACKSSTQAIRCVNGWSVDSAGGCVPSGEVASCVDGQYWDSKAGTCVSCSPACQTCIGPSSDECLRCTSPRANLQGSCVPYDVLTGVCDSSGVSVEGTTIMDNGKGRCDACPRGCTTCAIPGYSVTSTRQDLRCTACQEGWVLQDGMCMQQCGPGWFLPIASPSINGTCQPCDGKQCSDCISSSTRCTACADSGKYATPEGECVSSCPEGTFASESGDRKCVPCPVECDTCLASGHCLKCSKAFPVMNWATGRCSADCFASTYWQPSTSSCASCYANCTSCTGPNDGQCLSCAPGSILKGGSCGYGVCNVVPQLGICLSDDNDNGNTWWPWLLSVLLTLGIFCGIAWWICRSRRQRRQGTAAFAATLDDSEVNKKMVGLSGVFQILNPYKVHVRAPSREAFLPAPQKVWTTYREPRFSDDINDTGEASPPYLATRPPPYQPSLRLSRLDVKDPVVPALLKEGPLRAPYIERPDIEDSVKAFDRGKRPFTNRVTSWDGRSFGDDEQDINEWLRDDDESNIPLRDRNPFRVV